MGCNKNCMGCFIDYDMLNLVGENERLTMNKALEDLIKDLDADYKHMMMFAENLKWKIEWIRMKLQERNPNDS